MNYSNFYDFAIHGRRSGQYALYGLPLTNDQRIDAINDALNASDYNRYAVTGRRVCNCGNDGATYGYKCALDAHRKWYQDVLEARENAAKDAHRKKFSNVLDALKEIGKKSDTLVKEPTPSSELEIEIPKLNLTTIHDINKMILATAKEIANNAKIIEALADLKARALTLKDQKRDIIELTEDIEELFTK